MKFNFLKKIPNCMICKWVLMGTDREGKPRPGLCKVQGGITTNSVYGTKQCKALFKKKPQK